MGKTHLFLCLSEFILEEVGRRNIALNWNMSPAMKTMGRLALCGWQAGSGFSLEEPDYRQLWRLLAKASPTSLHSGLGAECMLEICDLLSGYLFGHHHYPPLIRKI